MAGATGVSGGSPRVRRWREFGCVRSVSSGW
jgi:hypothetical protein